MKIKRKVLKPIKISRQNFYKEELSLEQERIMNEYCKIKKEEDLEFIKNFI